MALRRKRTLVVLGVFMAVGIPVPAGAVAPGENGQIAFTNLYDKENLERRIEVVNPDGSGRAVLVDGTDPSYSPDGSRLAFQRDGGILVRTLETGEEVQLTTGPDDSSPAFSPDSGQIAFLRELAPDPSCDNILNTEVFLMGADGSAETQITFQPCGQAGRPDWSPDGTRFAYDNGFYNDDFSLGSWTLTIHTLGTDSFEQIDTGFDLNFNPTWSPDGATLAFEASGEIHTIPPGGGEPTQLTQTESCFSADPIYSPDGTKIAYATCQVAEGDEQNYDIFVMNADGSSPTRVTTLAGGYEQSPEWGPPSGAAPEPEPEPEPEPGPPAEGGFDGDPATPDAIDAGDPVAAAIAIAGARFLDADAGGPAAGAASTFSASHEQQAHYVVLSRDDAFPDSLAGAALTADGPLLFTDSQTLTPATRTEIQRVLAPGGTVYLLGGTNAVSQAIEDTLTGDGYAPQRLFGPSRVETSIAVADEVRSLRGSTEVALARAFGATGNETSGWADSVTGGAWAAEAGVPILVTPSESVAPAVADWLTANSPSRTVLLGGTAALSAEVEAQVPAPQRVFGAERAATAAEIARQLWATPASGSRQFVIINGSHPQGWIFGLAAGGLAADADAPLLMVGDDVPDETRQLASSPNEDVDLLFTGDTTIIRQQVRDELESLDG